MQYNCMHTALVHLASGIISGNCEDSYSHIEAVGNQCDFLVLLLSLDSGTVEFYFPEPI